jgi:hypothetical protein
MFVVGCFMLAPTAAFAQASIVGTVRDASGSVLPGVTVEASSPALIEKTRAVVTNGAGQYSIEDLRPGTYSVTFTLTGFATFQRGGIELSGSFIASVDASLRVGGLQETITVTGETPIVDVTSSRNQMTLSSDTISSIPSSRLYSAFTGVVPAINVQGNDVGASQGALFSVFQIHGGRRNEGQVLVDGMSGGYQGMGVSSYVPEIGNAQEVVFSLAGGLGEANTGGPQLNIIGRQGGNNFAGSFFVTGSGSAFVGNNLTPELQQQYPNLRVPLKPKQLWDINPSFGGPIVRDRLWFFGTYRYQMNRQYVASMFDNRNAGDPSKWHYDPDFETQSVDDGTWNNGSLRLTWQVSPRNKITAWTDWQDICQHCTGGGSSSGLTFAGTIASNEALDRVENRPNAMNQISWTSPVSHRLLLEADAQLGPYFWWGGLQKNPYDSSFIQVQEDSVSAIIPTGPGQCGAAGQPVCGLPGMNYRKANGANHKSFTNILQGSLSYVTGSHSAKFGVRWMHNDNVFPINVYSDQQLKYFFMNGAPVRLTMYGTDANSHQQQQQTITAFYAQDRWTTGRLSLQGGLRYEHLSDYFPEQRIGPNLFIPQARVFPAQEGPLSLHDLMPRFGASYDLFGNGKTAVKAFLGRYVTTTNTVDEWVNYSPAGLGHFVSTTDRNWFDRGNEPVPTSGIPGGGIAGDYIAQCDMLNPLPNGECGGYTNPLFGQYVDPLRLDPETTTGWNNREFSWDFNVGVTHEIVPRVSVEVSYVRRSWGNLNITVNEALTPADFDTFTYTTPQDSRLPDGGGYALTFKDVKPAKFGQQQSLRTFSDSAGGSTNTFNGVDFTVNARLQDVVVQGGFSTGNVVEDECGAAANHPDIYINQLYGGSLGFFGTTPFLTGLQQWPIEFCHRESGYTTNVKGLVTYTVPKIDVLLSTTFRSLPYPGANAPSIENQSLSGDAVIAPAFATNLGRPLANGSPITFVEIVEPGALYGDRLNQVDFRVGKLFRFSGTRTLVALDIFNMFNSNGADVYQQTYSAPSPTSTYLYPLSITVPRLFKISAQFDF